MLHEFLKKNREKILDLTAEKTKALAGSHPTSEQLSQGLPIFYDQLIMVLEKKLTAIPPEEMLATAAIHGKEYLRLGYSLSHVVHAYGAMCQAITELATLHNANISPSEFNIFNACLDVAIAAAVSEFQYRSNIVMEEREVLHLGFLAHELRNALSSATIAHDMIKAGLVGMGGSTASVLEANLVRMRNLIDRSLSEVRMRADSDLYIEKFRLADLLDQIMITAQIDSNKRNQTIHTEVDWKIEVEADRQFILSAVANLIQNAIKYTKRGGNIWLRGKLVRDRVFIEIEDQCGGIETDRIKTMFEPYVQDSENKSGLGLGLAITQRAVQLSQGKITVNNTPGVGCSFTIEIPQKIVPGPSLKNAVPGKDSIQPNLSKNKKGNK